MPPTPVIFVSALRFASINVIVITLLVCLHVVSLVAPSLVGENRVSAQLTEWFSLDGEGNFPALYSALILLLSAILFQLVAICCRGNQRHQATWGYWQALAGVFAFLAMDEAILIHEKFDNNTLLGWVNTSGLLAWPWVILYSLLVLIFIAVFFRFWWGLEPFFRVGYAVAAVMFVTGGIGLEMAGAYVYTLSDSESLPYRILVIVEESLEMTAIVLLISINLTIVARYFPSCILPFSSSLTSRSPITGQR